MVLSITIGTVAMFAIFIGSYYLVDVISTAYLAIGFGVIELIVMSLFNWKFFRLNDATMGFDKILNCIPFINYSVSMRPVMSWVTIGSEIIFVLLALVSFFPSILNLFGEFVLLQAPEYLPMIQVVAFFVLNIIIGIGLIPVVRDVNNLYENTIGKINRGKSSKKTKALATIVAYVPTLTLFLLLFPFTRCVALFLCFEREQELDKLNVHFD